MKKNKYNGNFENITNLEDNLQNTNDDNLYDILPSQTTNPKKIQTSFKKPNEIKTAISRSKNKRNNVEVEKNDDNQIDGTLNQMDKKLSQLSVKQSDNVSISSKMLKKVDYMDEKTNMKFIATQGQELLHRDMQPPLKDIKDGIISMDDNNLNEFSYSVTQKINNNVRNIGEDILGKTQNNHQESLITKINRDINDVENERKKNAIVCCFNGLYPNKIGKPPDKNLNADTFKSVGNILLMDHFQLPFDKGCQDFQTGGHICFTQLFNGQINFEWDTGDCFLKPNQALISDCTSIRSMAITFTKRDQNLIKQNADVHDAEILKARDNTENNNDKNLSSFSMGKNNPNVINNGNYYNLRKQNKNINKTNNPVTQTSSKSFNSQNNDGFNLIPKQIKTVDSSSLGLSSKIPYQINTDFNSSILMDNHSEINSKREYHDFETIGNIRKPFNSILDQDQSQNVVGIHVWLAVEETDIEILIDDANEESDRDSVLSNQDRNNADLKNSELLLDQSKQKFIVHDDQDVTIVQGNINGEQTTMQNKINNKCMLKVSGKDVKEDSKLMVETMTSKVSVVQIRTKETTQAENVKMVPLSTRDQPDLVDPITSDNCPVSKNVVMNEHVADNIRLFNRIKGNKDAVDKWFSYSFHPQLQDEGFINKIKHDQDQQTEQENSYNDRKSMNAQVMKESYYDSGDFDI